MSSVDVRPSGASGLAPGLKRLGLVLGLPLLDGVFVMLVLAGVLDSLAGIVLVGAVVFGGGGAIAVILTDLAETPRQHLPGLLILGGVLVPLAAIQAALAPTIATVLDERILAYVAAILLVMIGIQIGSRQLQRRLPSAGLVVIVGLLVSFRPNGLAIERTVDLGLALAGGLAALIGVGLAVGVLLLGSSLLGTIDQERFRYGGGIALAVLGVSILFPISAYVPLVILGFAILLAVDLDRSSVFDDCPEDGTLEPFAE